MEDKLIDKLIYTIGYGVEANVICFIRKHMLAVVSFMGTPIQEVIRFVDSDFSFISEDSDIFERELLPFSIYRGYHDDCMRLYDFYCSLPFVPLKG